MKIVRVSPLFALTAAVLALAGCKADNTAEKGAATAAPSEQASGPDAKPGLAANAGVLILPAVKGRPGAAYFTVSNTSDKPASLAAVHIDGAVKTEVHETKGGSMQAVKVVPVAPGAVVKFERGGMHVMAFELDDKLAAGGTTEMTLSFADGDKLSIPLAIQATGAAAHGAAH